MASKRQPRKDARSGEPRPATLADVARRAGVVSMTASRAINGSGYVSEEVRARVLKIARELNYRPNVLARKLRGRDLRAVGVLIPDIANPFSSELVKGMTEVLEANGYTTFLSTANRSVRQEEAGLLAFIDHRVDGILVATVGTQLGDDVLARIAAQGVPIVTVGRSIESVPIDHVTADHFRGAYEVTRHLIRLGHKRIGFIGVAPEHTGSLHRFAGYAAALAEAGIQQRVEYVVGPESGPAFSTEEDGFTGMLRLAKIRHHPTAVFARNDFTAIGAMRAVHELGLSVPDDIAIAGFDNIPLSAFTIPPLTTVEQPIAEQGRRAAQFLVDRMEHRVKEASRQVCLECRLIVRQSTDPSAAISRP